MVLFNFLFQVFPFYVVLKNVYEKIQITEILPFLDRALILFCCILLGVPILNDNETTFKPGTGIEIGFGIDKAILSDFF